MKIGITIEPFEGISADTLLSFGKAIALDHVEINVNIVPDIEGFVKGIDKLTTTFHLPIVEVEGYDPGFTTTKDKKTMADIVTFINKYHADLNMLFTLAHPPDTKKSDFNTMMENLEQIDTPIVLENIPWQKDEEFMEFYFKAKDRLGKHLAGHAIDGAHRFLTYFENWLDIPKELEKEIVYVHLQDTVKEYDAHLPLGHGVMPYKDILKYLRRLGYKGVINQEIKPKGLDLESIMDSCLD
ncbi:MAG: sugar phosphate isomerase/epimerase family protein [Candidatus Heimdallarchaeota archaeon]